MSPVEKQHQLRVIVAFALVYVVWGSTYLALKLAVDGIPPTLVGGIRFLIAGVLMLAACAFTGRKIAITLNDFWRISVVAICLLTVANVGVTWSEIHVPTGLVALIVAVVPIWFLMIESWLIRSDHKLAPQGVAGVLLGIVGIVVLLWPQLRNTASLTGMQFLASLALIGFSFSWAFGSVFGKKYPAKVDPFSATGWQMTIAGTVNLLLSFLLGAHKEVHWYPKSVWAVVYLIVFGSWVGYTAYVWLLKHVPTAKVATYAYVNPVVAVFLGWLVLDETIDAYMIAGSVVIIAAVVLVTRAKVTHHAPEKKKEESFDELPAVEAGAD